VPAVAAPTETKSEITKMPLAIRWFLVSVIALPLASIIRDPIRAAERPNILWLSCEDISPHLACYGDPYATTPNLDRFAQRGLRFTHAFTTAGVCAPCRSAIITSMYQTALGTQHMRCQAKLPDQVRPFPSYLREAGYYCTNNSKQDYQFKTPSDTWDESSGKAHWKNRPTSDTPFFAVFNYTGCHESGIASDSKYRDVTREIAPHDRRVVAGTLPPYYPDTPITREDWGRYYDVITAMDRWFGERLAELEAAGLADNTIVFFWSDHGVGLPRAKRWLYDSGTRVPLIVHIPQKYRTGGQARPGTVTDQLVSLLDLGPTLLNLVGAEIPRHLQGRPFLGPKLPPPREYVFGARDRMDERYDIIRTVRDRRYRYIRNYEPFKAYYQYMNTPEKGRTMQEIRRVQASGEATPAVALFLAESKPVEELYDTVNDPHEVHNLAQSPQHQDHLARLRAAHLEWVLETRDLGLVPEAEINAREQAAGSAWAILGRSQAGDLISRLREAASLSLEGSESLDRMQAALNDPDAAVRYWGAVGIGNLGPLASTAAPQLREAFQDDSENVRVAAARALCRMRMPEHALPVLVAVLDDGSQWARLHAAIVLDEIDELARPVLSAMRRNNVPRPGLVANGKYTVRVLNRALNELLGTNDVVP
jgi:uncharacterized sulfatase